MMFKNYKRVYLIVEFQSLEKPHLKKFERIFSTQSMILSVFTIVALVMKVSTTPIYSFETRDSICSVVKPSTACPKENEYACCGRYGIQCTSGLWEEVLDCGTAGQSTRSCIFGKDEPSGLPVTCNNG